MQMKQSQIDFNIPSCAIDRAALIEHKSKYQE